jgi:aspartate aminotransferase
MASRAVDARRSAIREVFDLANRIPDAIRLEIGEPSFRTPKHIVEAAHEAARAGFTRYTPNGGYASLREALAEKLERVDGYAVDPDSVVVTPGAMNALFSIYLALLEPNDEVLLPTPGFPNMDEMVRLLGGKPVFYRLDAAGGYLPSVAEIAALVGPRTKAIFANTPGNPTGAVFPAETVRALGELAAERGVWLISDEVYDELGGGGRATRARDLRLQLLEDLRDDRLADRLLRRAAGARSGAAQAAGAPGLVPIGDLAAGC